MEYVDGEKCGESTGCAGGGEKKGPLSGPPQKKHPLGSFTPTYVAFCSTQNSTSTKVPAILLS